MAEKQAICKLSLETGVKQGPNLEDLRPFSSIIASSTDYFNDPLTKNVNLRSVLVAHSHDSWQELNKITELHDNASYEQPFGDSMMNYCRDLVWKGKVKENFPSQVFTLSVDWPTNLYIERF